MTGNKHPMAKVRELMELAEIYFEDGALFTGAARLRAAADIAEGLAKATYAEMDAAS